MFEISMPRSFTDSCLSQFENDPVGLGPSALDGIKLLWVCFQSAKACHINSKTFT